MSHFRGKLMNIRHQRGFSMIEALFSALILGVALLGLAGFHAVALKDGSLTKARSVAANLAHEKLDDLRSFTRLEGDATACGAGTFCFSEIAADAGGQEGGGGLVLPAGTIAGYTDNYSLAWTVTCSAQTAGAALSFGTTCTDASAKLVTVTTSWTDSEGAPQTVSLQGVIYAMDPSRMALAAGPAYSNQLPKKPAYVPIGVPDAVPVPINTGDGKFKESSKPLPDLSSKGYSLRTEFDSVSYTTAGGTTSKDSQLEFATVNCVCQFAGTGSGYPASYFSWDGSNLQVKTPDEMVSKMTGTAPTMNGDPQDELCTACCRDHHDSEAPGTSGATTALYDPGRPTMDYTGNNHKHYYYTDSTNPGGELVEVAETAGNLYLEACRFARVDGIHRLLQDWRALDMVVIPDDNYLTNSGTLSAYQNYLVDYLRYRAMADCASSGASGCTSLSAPSKASLPTRDLSNQEAATYNQLLARALYADRVYGETAPRTLDAAYYSGLASRISNNETWLDLLPFNEVNVTLLANWASSDSLVVTVTNEDVLDIDATAVNYYGVYSRGLTQIQPGDGGSADVTAYLLPSNSGLTGGVKRAPVTGATDYDSALAASATAISYAGPVGIDRDDHRSANRKSDTVNISRVSVSSAPPNTGNIRRGNTSGDLLSTELSVSACTDVTDLSTCTACSDAAPTGDVTTYSCPINYLFDGILRITSTTPGVFFDVGGDTTYDAVERAVVPETTCDVSSGKINPDCLNFWVFGSTAQVKGKCWGSECTTSTFASKLNGTGPDVACTLDGFDVTCPVTLDPTTKTWTGRIKITGTGATYVSATSTCSIMDGTSPKTTAYSIDAGPVDRQSAFNVCATSAGSAVAPAAPVLAWAGINNPKTLAWSSVEGATGYKIYTCSRSNVNSLQACVPGQLVTTQSGTAYDPADPLAKQTICVAAMSTNGTYDSVLSSTKCVYRDASGNKYSYQ